MPKRAAVGGGLLRDSPRDRTIIGYAHDQPRLPSIKKLLRAHNQPPQNPQKPSTNNNLRHPTRNPIEGKAGAQ